MKIFIFIVIVVILFIGVIIGLYKRAVIKNREKQIYRSARIQSQLIDNQVDKK